MAYKIKLGSFSKLENSTAQPTVTLWAEYEINLKEGCDISNPEITLSIDWATVSGYNYAKLLDRYYWIVGKNMLRENLCVLQLKVDVLATYKTDIGNANLYVLRSAYAYDSYIKDNYYPITNRVTKYHQEVATGYQDTFANGRMVLSIAGTNTGGVATLIELDMTSFVALINELYTKLNSFQLSDIIAQLGCLFGGNPQSLISGAMWFPSGFITASPDYVSIGAWTSTSVQGSAITDPLMAASSFSFDLYKHPQDSRGLYLDASPYSNYYLTIPGAGTIALDTSRLIGETKIEVIPLMDAFTGICRMEVYAFTSRQLLAQVDCQWGIPIALRGDGKGQDFFSGFISTVGAAALAIETGNPGMIAGALNSGIGTALDAIGGTGASSGVGGSILNTYTAVMTLDSVFYKVADGDNTEHGKPLCTNFQISSLPGYNIVSEGNVPIAGPLPEQLEIKRFLESGFFYE